jgi:5-formyltetrahydrofolate cyclo-ligase
VASVDSNKQRIRESVWNRLRDSGAALFPGAHGRIPNFRGAAEAAERLAATPEWRRARTIKCNPDAPQRPVRLRALRDGKLLFMAVPKLRALRCFWKLDPRKIPKGDFRKAATIGGAALFGAALEPGALPRIDLIVAGCVAVNPGGARLGKGGGYSDLEYAIGREVGTVDEQTVVATTVHPLQLIQEDLPETAHDFRLDLIVTPQEVIRPKGRRRQPAGILRAHLTKQLRGSVPILRRLGF